MFAPFVLILVLVLCTSTTCSSFHSKLLPTINAISSSSDSSTLLQATSGMNLWKTTTGKRSIAVIKEELLNLARKVNRGVNETPEEREKILDLFNELESNYGQKDTLSNPNLNAVWSLEYTTSNSMAGRKGFPRIGPILQIVNAKELKAENREVLRLWNLFKLGQRVTAELIPRSSTEVEVQFKRFTIGPISFPAPSSAKGTLDITYVDKDLRLSRGNKGNIFILTRYEDLPDSN